MYSIPNDGSNPIELVGDIPGTGYIADVHRMGTVKSASNLLVGEQKDEIIEMVEGCSADGEGDVLTGDTNYSVSPLHNGDVPLKSLGKYDSVKSISSKNNRSASPAFSFDENENVSEYMIVEEDNKSDIIAILEDESGLEHNIAMPAMAGDYNNKSIVDNHGYICDEDERVVASDNNVGSGALPSAMTIGGTKGKMTAGDNYNSANTSGNFVPLVVTSGMDMDESSEDNPPPAPLPPAF